MDVLLEPTSEAANFLATVAIGDKYLSAFRDVSKNTFERYCKKHGLGLVVLDQTLPSDNPKTLHWQKLLLASKLKDIGCSNACYLDYDFILNPAAPNIFVHWDSSKIGLVSQHRNLPYISEMALRKNIAFLRHTYLSKDYPLDSSLLASIDQTYNMSGLPPQPDYACAGMFLFNVERYGDWFSDVEKRYKSQPDTLDGGEEVLLNFHWQTECEIDWLGYEWQSLWIYEAAAKYGHLYKSRFEDEHACRSAVWSSLLSCNFLHFAGRWEFNAFLSCGGLISDEEQAALQKHACFQKAEVTGNNRGFVQPNE